MRAAIQKAAPSIGADHAKRIAEEAAEITRSVLPSEWEAKFFPPEGERDGEPTSSPPDTESVENGKR